MIQPFYDRLLAVGYSIGPLSSGSYPWLSSPSPANDYAMANIGQVKFLFSFDLNISSDGSGIPDWWKNDFFPGTTVDPGGYSAGNGLTNLENYQDGINPKIQLQVNVIVQ